MTRATQSVRLNREIREGTLPPTLIAKTYHPGNVTDVSRPLIRSLSYEFQCHQRKTNTSFMFHKIYFVWHRPFAVLAFVLNVNTQCGQSKTSRYLNPHCSRKSTSLGSTQVTSRQSTRLTTTNAVEINRQE